VRTHVRRARFAAAAHAAAAVAAPLLGVWVATAITDMMGSVKVQAVCRSGTTRGLAETILCISRSETACGLAASATSLCMGRSGIVRGQTIAAAVGGESDESTSAAASASMSAAASGGEIVDAEAVNESVGAIKARSVLEASAIRKVTVTEMILSLLTAVVQETSLLALLRRQMMAHTCRLAASKPTCYVVQQRASGSSAANQV